MEKKSSDVDRMFGSYLSASILTIAAVQVANIVDASLVGNFVGDNGLAAVNVCRPVLQAIFSLSVFFVSGGTMLVGMAIGRKDSEGADRIFSLSMGMTVSVALLISLVGTAFLGPLVSMLCKSEAVLPLARDFLRVMLLSAVPMMLMTAVDFYVTVDGEPKRASFAVIVSNIVNLVLDVVFMKYLGWGITGAALATCIMYLVCILLVLPHFRRDGTLRLTGNIRKSDARPIVAYGLPLFISSILLSVQFACNNIVCSRYFGDSGLVAYAVCMQLLVFSTIFLNGTYRTIQPVGAILKGRDDTYGIHLLIRKAYSFLFISLSVFSALAIAFPRQITMLLGVGDIGNISVAVAAIPAFTLQIILQTLIGNVVPIYQIYSRNKLALFLSVVQAILPFFGFWLFSEISLHYTVLNPWLGFAAGQLASALLLLIPVCLIRRRTTELSPLFLVPRVAGLRDSDN